MEKSISWQHVFKWNVFGACQNRLCNNRITTFHACSRFIEIVENKPSGMKNVSRGKKKKSNAFYSEVKSQSVGSDRLLSHGDITGKAHE